MANQNPETEHQQFNPEEYSLEEILKPKKCALIVVDEEVIENNWQSKQ